MNFLFAAVAGTGVFLLAKKAAPNPESTVPTPVTDDVKARQGGGDGAQADQAGVPVTAVAVTAAAPSSVQTSTSATRIMTAPPVPPGGVIKPIRGVSRTERFAPMNPVASCGGGCPKETQSAANRLIASGLGSDLVF